MSKLKKLIGEGRAIFASVLCLLTCGLLAPSAVAAEPTIAFTLDGEETTVVVPANPKKSVARFNLSLSESWTGGDGKVKVTVAPVANIPSGDIYRYVHISDTLDETTAWENAGTVTVTFDTQAESPVLTKPVYVYAIDSCKYTADKDYPVRFRVVKAEPAAAATFYGTIKDSDYIHVLPPPVDFVDADGKTQTTNAYVVKASDEAVSWNAGWYVVTNEVSIYGGAAVEGDVKLILADGCRATLKGYSASETPGILVTNAVPSSPVNKLTIYGQSGGTGTLIANGGDGAAGIGGGCKGTGSYITINGGKVTATGGNGGAGIGNGSEATTEASEIHVADDLIVKAGGTTEPTEEISHDGKTDIAAALAGKRYVTVEKALPRVPDYAEATGRDWLYNHAIAGKACPDEAKVSDVDLFYVYPTLVGDEKVVIDGFRGIDDATMRGTATNFMTAVGVYCNSARCFADMTHVYAPFYRQATFDTATDCATNAQGQVAADANDRFLAKLCEGPAYADVTNALTTYFAKWNKGRKFVIAGHSQGSAILRLVMEKYFVENPDKAKLLVCSYQIGFGIGQASIDKITKATGVTFATKADDTNVIVSYNTMGENASGNSVLLPADTLAINPLTWTRNGDLADKGLNLGALTNDVGKADVIVPHLYGAQVVSAENRGQTVECAELTDKALAPCLFGTGSLYMYDYGAYWEDLHMNCYDRITASTGTAPSGVYKLVETNGIPAVADTTWRIAFDGGEMMVSPANGKCYVRDGVTQVKLVYTADAAKVAEGYVFQNGGTEMAFDLSLVQGTWKLTTSAEEIAAATKMGKPTVQLGVVAQRYPWNGQVDVEYKAMNVPANKYKVAVTVEFGGVKKTFTLNEYAKTGIAKSSVDVKADFGEVKGAVKVSAELVELPPE